MKKIICTALLLIFQITLNATQLAEKKFKKIELSNGIDVLFYEDFRSPIANVGIIFHVGEQEEALHESGINKIIAANIIDQKMHKNFIKSGISYGVTLGRKCTELSAKMHPKCIKDFFSLICDLISRRIVIEDLDATKNGIEIKHRLRTIYKVHAIIDNAISTISPNMVFNETSFSSITKTDVERFFDEHYGDCHISIIVCGSIGYKNLMKILQSSVVKLPKRKPARIHIPKNIIFKDVSMESKHSRNGMVYVYTISKEDDIKYGDVFVDILDCEMFRFFQKTNNLVQRYDVEKFSTEGNCFLLISLCPKADISIEHLKNMYEVFINKMTSIILSEKIMFSISNKINTKNQILLTNLDAIYGILRNSYINGTDINYIHNATKRIKETNSVNLKTFAAKIFRKNMIAKIKTQFNSDS